MRTRRIEERIRFLSFPLPTFCFYPDSNSSPHYRLPPPVTLLLLLLLLKHCLLLQPCQLPFRLPHPQHPRRLLDPLRTLSFLSPQPPQLLLPRCALPSSHATRFASQNRLEITRLTPDPVLQEPSRIPRKRL